MFPDMQNRIHPLDENSFDLSIGMFAHIPGHCEREGCRKKKVETKDLRQCRRCCIVECKECFKNHHPDYCCSPEDNLIEAQLSLNSTVVEMGLGI